MSLLRKLTPAVHRLDHALGRFAPGRRVLIEMRTPVYHAVLSPIAEALARLDGVDLFFTSEYPDRIVPLVGSDRFLRHEEVEWRRFDVYLNADPWAAARVRRCAHRVSFFHGVAGKYDLDNPAGLPMGFEAYDRVGFVNEDRLCRYLASGIVTTSQAALVGYPKLDALVNGAIDVAAVRRDLGLSVDRPVAMYAPTYSEASSLHLAGEAIVRSLSDAGFSVIVKLHDRSLDPDPRYNGGIDWRQRFAALERPGSVRFTEQADASPLLACADVLVTDHSSIGFEYLVLDRPLIVFDAPDLTRAARINPEKVALLRSAATVVTSAESTAAAARAELQRPAILSAIRRQIAATLFYNAGSATARAVDLLTPYLHHASGRSAAARAVGERS